MALLFNHTSFKKSYVIFTKNKVLWVPSREMRRGASDAINSIVRSRSPSPTGMSCAQQIVTLSSRKGSTLLPGTNPNVLGFRGYATYNFNQPDLNNKDPKADKNNKVVGKPGKTFKHKEIHRTTCKKSDCKDRFCKTHCHTIIKREAIGHATHGKSPVNETDKTTEKVRHEDFSNKPIPQNIAFYGTPHETAITPTVEPGNTIINADKKE